MQFESAWDDYWQNGFMDCLPDDEAMRSALATFWQAQLFKLQLPNQKPTIVELGCGAGFLTVLLADYVKKQAINGDIIALDYSSAEALNELWRRTGLLSQKEIRLIAERSIEATHLKNDSAQLVCANYAFEYADRDKAVAELSRILSLDGQFLLFCHQENSSLSQQNFAIVAAIEKLFSDNSLLLKIEKLFAMGEHESQQHFYVDKAKAIIDILHTIDTCTNHGLQKSGFINAVLPLFRLPTLKRTEAWQQLLASYSQYLLRIKHQLAAQLDESKIEELRNLFAENGCALSNIEVYNWRDHLLGVMLKGRKLPTVSAK